jgi:hypothetical protein
VKCSDTIAWPSIIKRLLGESAAMTVKAAQHAAKASVLNGEKTVTENLLIKAISELIRDDNQDVQE